MKILFLVFITSITFSCSKNGGSDSSTLTAGRNSGQDQALKAGIAEDLNSLRQTRYEIENSEIDILDEEGLLTQAEKDALRTIQ